MRNLDNLSWHDKDVLIDHFMYHLKSDERERFARNLPVIYNKLHGEAIVTSQWGDGRTPLITADEFTI